MPEDERFAQGERTDGAVPIVMEVGAADSAMGVAHQNLTHFGRRRREVIDSQIARSMYYESLHRFAFLLVLQLRQHREHAAVDVHDLAVDKRGSIGGEIDQRAHQIFDFAPRPAGVRPRTQAENASSATSALVSSVSK